MTNVHTLRADRRWKAVIEYKSASGPIKSVHYFEELAELNLLIRRGPDWNSLEKCTLTLNRSDGGKTNGHQASKIDPMTFANGNGQAIDAESDVAR